jgi:hypothetical protein
MSTSLGGLALAEASRTARSPSAAGRRAPYTGRRSRPVVWDHRRRQRQGFVAGLGFWADVAGGQAIARRVATAGPD